MKRGWLTDMNEEQSQPKGKRSAAEAAEAAWASRAGLEYTADDFEGAIGHEPSRVIRRTNARLPSAWIIGPGAVQLLVEGLKLLLGASAAASLHQKQIHWVLPKLLPKRQVLLVAPAREGEPGVIEARRSGHGPLEFNVSEMLRLAEMEVRTGYRECFAVEKVATSPIGPAIAIKLGKALESRRMGGKKEE